MTRAILVNFHKYTPFGGEFYEPILDSFLASMEEYRGEYDHLYLLDSNWNIDLEKLEGLNASILRTDPNMRYYDCFKEVLPKIEEDLVLFLDDDMVIYKSIIILEAFERLQTKKHPADVVSITDTIGTMQVPLKTGNKLCPYFFATRKDLLMKYLDVDWSPDAMPYTETFGLLTEAMLKDGLKAFEMEDDKTEVKSWDPLETDKTLGYYHVRAGSTIAYLLAEKTYGNPETYWKYLESQPASEIIRHCGWYTWMGGNSEEVLKDLNA